MEHQGIARIATTDSLWEINVVFVLHFCVWVVVPSFLSYLEGRRRWAVGDPIAVVFVAELPLSCTVLLVQHVYLPAKSGVWS